MGEGGGVSAATIVSSSALEIKLGSSRAKPMVSWRPNTDHHQTRWARDHQTWICHCQVENDRHPVAVQQRKLMSWDPGSTVTGQPSRVINHQSRSHPTLERPYSIHGRTCPVHLCPLTVSLPPLFLSIPFSFSLSLSLSLCPCLSLSLSLSLSLFSLFDSAVGSNAARRQQNPAAQRVAVYASDSPARSATRCR